MAHELNARLVVLLQTIRDGVALLTWESDTFAYADGCDEAAKRYRGLRAGEVVTLSVEAGGLLVKGDVARRPRRQPHRRLGSRPPAQLGADVTVTLEIDAILSEGANDQLVRTVTENGRTLGFETFEFEKE